MKKGAILILLVISMFFIPVGSNDSNKELNVIVTIDDSGLGKVNAIKELRKSNIEKIAELRHDFGDKIAITVDEDELNKIKPYIKDIKEERKLRIFLQDSVPLVNATQVWGIQVKGINITGIDETICIIDTGVNFTHSDLAGKNVSCVVDCVGKQCVENCSIGDDHGHGTHVAGIVAAKGGINGVAIDAKILAIKVLNASGNGDESDLKAGIDYCVNKSTAYNVSVISMSLGTDLLYSTYCDSDYVIGANLTGAINDAIAKNISVIAATGNDFNKNSIASPACIQNATAVAWSNKDDTANSQSNSNSITDLIAPGSSINSTSGKSLVGCSTSGSYMICSGTSMATPHVAAGFALLRQFARLDANKFFLPSEIENEFKLTGKRIQDSNGINFSRISIYEAIRHFAAPDVFLVSPLNATITNNNQTDFTCNATTDSQTAILSNITFFISNNTMLLFNQTKNVSGIFNQSSFNYNLTLEQEYTWRCEAFDNRSYTGTSQNFTLTYDKTLPIITILSPENKTYKDAQFNITTNENASWCGYSLDIQVNVTMTKFNSTFFNYTLTNISEGIHNVSFSCNDTANNFNSTMLREFNINRTKPTISLISPTNGASTKGSVTFTYNVTHYRNISSCSLYLDSILIKTNESINLSKENTIIYSPSAGTYRWSINCTDDIGNIGNSTSFSITIESEPFASSGGGGGGRRFGATYEIKEEEIKEGTSRSIYSDDKLAFQINTGNHHVKILKIGKDYVNIEINSTPRNDTLFINDSKKYDLNNDFYYDLFVKLEEIKNNKANLTIKEIYEAIQKEEKQEENKTIEEREIRAFDTAETLEDKYNINKKVKYFIFVYTVIVLIIVIIVKLFISHKLNIINERNK
ncbi:S8 family serine peptidase [Candidatus Pacearchaeota archaeon]|nr:S8 family serine peptidase [Candidatus Pacearchaeota archaeon]